MSGAPTTHANACGPRALGSCKGSHVSTHDRLWSNLPFLRPLVTITDDSLASYGIDEHGGRLHDLLGTRCDPYVEPYVDRGGLSPPLPLEPDPCGIAPWTDGIRCA